MAQTDSLIYRENQLKKLGGNYYNYANPEKFNIEVIIWGGVKNPGIYLVPEGSTFIELMSLSGGTIDDKMYENIKLIRAQEKSSNLKADTVYVFNYQDFFDPESKNKINKPNPVLKSGDIIVLPIKPETDFWDRLGKISSIIILPLFSLATLIVNIIILSKQ
jgi:hypothetical protein